MDTLMTLLSLSVIVFTIKSNVSLGEIIFDKDRLYDTIKFKVPQVVWKQALHPTPVLRSPVTIVLPIHVQQDEENHLDDDEEEQPIATESIPVDATLVQDEQQLIVNNTTAVVQQPTTSLQDDSMLAEPDVTGQVTRFPCSCVDGQCGCCTGAILERFRMKACGNISFVPEDFVFDVRLSVNNNTVVRRRVSASDPPPICFNPRRAPFVRVCAEISNIRIRNRNAFACLDINADVAGFPVYSASFRCFGLGVSGLQTGLKPKPVSSGPAPVSLFGNNENEDEGGILDDAAGTVFGGGGDGLFGGSEGLFGGGNDEGPLDAIGDAVGELFDGRNLD